MVNRSRGYALTPFPLPLRGRGYETTQTKTGSGSVRERSLTLFEMTDTWFVVIPSESEESFSHLVNHGRWKLNHSRNIAKRLSITWLGTVDRCSHSDRAVCRYVSVNSSSALSFFTAGSRMLMTSIVAFTAAIVGVRLSAHLMLRVVLVREVDHVAILSARRIRRGTVGSARARSGKTARRLDSRAYNVSSHPISLRRSLAYSR